uniref:Uncharacterized protein LOC114334326 isoform X2 n=1 Tax=Diabrotica virgifera virgifera TaxID=50390 RepID=A0A6P7FUN0_DIAVI
MELREDFVKIKQNVLICDKGGDSLEEHVNVEVKSELEYGTFEVNYTQDSLPDSYCSDDVKIEEHLQCEEDGDSLEQHINVEVKSELEDCMFEGNYTQDSLSVSYCSDDIKIEEHTIVEYKISRPFLPICKQEVKTEIKKELDEPNLGVNHGCETRNTKELDSDRDVKLQIGASTEIHQVQHRSMKTSKLLSNIGKQN